MGMRSMIKEMDPCRRAHTCVINGLLLILFLSLFLFSSEKKHMHACIHARTHVRTHINTYKHTHLLSNAVETRAKQIMANDIHKVFKESFLRIPFTNSFMNYEHNIVIAYLPITFFVL